MSDVDGPPEVNADSTRATRRRELRRRIDGIFLIGGAVLWLALLVAWGPMVRAAGMEFGDTFPSLMTVLLAGLVLLPHAWFAYAIDGGA